jgi:hypothetical protein
MMRFRDECDKGCENLGKSETENLALIRKAFGGREHVLYVVQSRLKKVREVKSKVKSMIIIFSDIRIVNKGFVLSGQTVNSAYMFCGECVKISEELSQKFSDKETDCCITATHRLTLSFLPGNF